MTNEDQLKNALEAFENEWYRLDYVTEPIRHRRALSVALSAFKEAPATTGDWREEVEDAFDEMHQITEGGCDTRGPDVANMVAALGLRRIEVPTSDVRELAQIIKDFWWECEAGEKPPKDQNGEPSAGDAALAAAILAAGFHRSEVPTNDEREALNALYWTHPDGYTTGLHPHQIDAILAAGFRRSGVPEPSGDDFPHGHPELDPKPRGEPSSDVESDPLYLTLFAIAKRAIGDEDYGQQAWHWMAHDVTLWLRGLSDGHSDSYRMGWRDGHAAAIHERTKVLRDFRQSLIDQQMKDFGVVMPDVQQIVDELELQADRIEKGEAW